MLSGAKCRSPLEDFAVIGTKHLLFIVKKKQIPRSGRDDIITPFSISLLNQFLLNKTPSSARDSTIWYACLMSIS